MKNSNLNAHRTILFWGLIIAELSGLRHEHRVHADDYAILNPFRGLSSLQDHREQM